MSETITYRGNNGIEFVKEERDGRVFYVGNNGVEYEYFKDEKLVLVGDDGIEWEIDRDNRLLYANNALIARYDKDKYGFYAIAMDDGSMYNSNEQAIFEVKLHNILTLLNATGDDLIDYTIWGNLRQYTQREISAKFVKVDDSTYKATCENATIDSCKIFGKQSQNLVNPEKLEEVIMESKDGYVQATAYRHSNLIFAKTGFSIRADVSLPVQPKISIPASETLPKTSNGITFSQTDSGIGISGTATSAAQLMIYDNKKAVYEGFKIRNAYTVSVSGIPDGVSVIIKKYYDDGSSDISGTITSTETSITVSPGTAWAGMQIILDVEKDTQIDDGTIITLTSQLSRYSVIFYAGLCKNDENAGYTVLYAPDSRFYKETSYSGLVCGKTHTLDIYSPIQDTSIAFNFFGIRSSCSGVKFDRTRICVQDKLNTDAIEFEAYSKGTGDANLIPYPYLNTTKTQLGITWTDNGDGSITASGTATSKTDFHLYTNENIMERTFVLSGTSAGFPEGAVMQIWEYSNSVYKKSTNVAAEGTVIQLNDDTDKYTIALSIKQDTTCNVTFYPQLELGTKATVYEKYKEIVDSPNLIAYPYRDSTKTVNGVTFTDNGDGSVTVSGTPTDTATYTFIKDPVLVAGGSIYTISTGAENASNIDFRLLIYAQDETLLEQKIFSSSTYTLTLPAEASKVGLYMSRTSPNQECQGIFKPQLKLKTQKIRIGVPPGKTRISFSYTPQSKTAQTISYLLDAPLSETEAIDPFRDRLITYEYQDVVFDGSENWTRPKANYYRVSTKVLRENTPNRDCTESINFTRVDFDNTDFNTFTSYGEDYIRVCIDESQLSSPTVEGFKEYLSKNAQCFRCLKSITEKKISSETI